MYAPSFRHASWALYGVGIRLAAASNALIWVSVQMNGSTRRDDPGN